jgi:hypothetical protein
LIDRARGSLFRAARVHREDFARADRQFQRSGDRTGIPRIENRQAFVVAERGNTNVRDQQIGDGQMEGSESLPSHTSQMASVFFELFGCAFARPSLSRQNIIVRRPSGAVDCSVCIVLALLRVKKNRLPNRRQKLTTLAGRYSVTLPGF